MFARVISTECTKLRRAGVPLVTLAVMLLAPWGIAMFMWIVRDPQRAAALGLLGSKASLVGLEATWPSYVHYLSAVCGATGMVLLAFIVAYLFGREYSEETAKVMLTLPLARHWFAFGKLAVAGVWWLVLTLLSLAEGFILGFLLGLPDFSPQIAAQGVGRTLVLAAACFLLCPTAAWLTVASHNVLAPVGFAVGMLLLGDLLSHTGWAIWFPWSIVPAMTGLTGGSGDALTGLSGTILVATFGLGTAATAAQLHWSDNH
jgi:ABC-type transport system involved in multi-copper enzyme maturation, permease component